MLDLKPDHLGTEVVGIHTCVKAGQSEQQCIDHYFLIYMEQ